MDFGRLGKNSVALSSKHPGLAIALALCLFALFLPSSPLVRANGVHVRSEEVFAGPVGSYEVQVLTNPVVGNLHLTISVLQQDGNLPADHPLVRVLARGPEGPDGRTQIVGPKVARGSLAGPNWYAVDMSVNETGSWLFNLTVDGPMGEEAADFRVEIRESGGVNWLVIGVVAFLLAAAFGYFTWKRVRVGKPRARRRGKGRRAAR